MRQIETEAHEKLDAREAGRGEADELAETEREIEELSREARRSPRIRAEIETRQVSDDGDDDDYRHFVERMWNATGAIAADLTLMRVDYSGVPVESHIASIVPRGNWSPYVNTIQDGAHKTYVAEWHRWLRDGRKVSRSAFLAIVEHGVPSDEALRPSASDRRGGARAENNHLKTKPALVIGYRHEDGAACYRVVSGVRRGDERAVHGPEAVGIAQETARRKIAQRMLDRRRPRLRVRG